MKSAKQTFVEFAREKGNLFDKWCCSSKVSTFEQLRELILVEDFKSCLPENIVVHLNEKKVAKLSDAAVITDEFVLTHRRVFPSVRQGRNRSPVDDTVKDLVRAGHLKSRSLRKPELKRTGDKRVCFYCLDPGHLISECRSWKQKNSSTKAKSVAFVKSSEDNDRLDSTSVYQPFLMSGFVSLSADSEVRPITILRDTGAAQSIILEVYCRSLL